MKSMALALLLLFACLLSARPAHADTPTQVAVAANFTKPAQEIAAAFSAETGHSLQLIFGASGALTQQIKAGAPFQLFLSADLENPKALIAAGQGVLGSAFTYAIGRLALFSPRPDLFDSAGRAGGRLILDQTAQCPGPGCFDHLAIANPETGQGAG